jgi:hypothetical protein
MKVHWFHAWEPVLDDALSALPEQPTSPHALVRELATSPSALPKRTALVTEGDDVVAVVPLRKHPHGWEPVTQWLVPGAVAPAQSGMVVPALVALNTRLVVAWWRMGDRPLHRHVRRVRSVPVHRLAVDQREQYWRRSKQLQNVNSARRKCAHLSLRVNHPGDEEWVIRGWDSRWRDGGAADPTLGDRILAARHLREAGVLRCLALTLDDQPVAGSTNFVHEQTLTAGLLHRDLDVGSVPTGVRLIDELFALAEQEGLDEVDLGGGHDYKGKWAPVGGHRYEFVVEPTLALVRRVVPGLPGRAGRALVALRSRPSPARNIA